MRTDLSVDSLVKMVGNGQLGLPEMQRQYVWSKEQVCNLLDSLYRGFPSGGILLWQTNETVPQRDFAVSQDASFLGSCLLLDGQQRLTSLLAVIRGEPVSVRGKKKKRSIELLFNLEHPERHPATEVDGQGRDEEEEDDESKLIGDEYEDGDEDGDECEDENDSTEDEKMKHFDQKTFAVATKKLEQLPQWVKVSEVFKADNDGQIYERAGLIGFKDPKYKKYGDRLAQLRHIQEYLYHVDVLEHTIDYDEVTEIFKRLNSGGSKLRSSDLALAQITSKWPGSSKIFESFQKKCTDEGFSLELGIHLKNLMVFATGQSRFRKVSDLTRGELQNAWKESCRGMEYALNFLRSNVGIESPALLSSPFLLVVLAYFGHHQSYELSPEDAQLLRYWSLIVNAKGRFSRGATETTLDEDITEIKQGNGALGLIARVRQQFGRLDIMPEELEGRGQRLFKIMFLAFRAAGAKDWISKLAINFDHSGVQHQLQYHHVFPKAILKKAGYSRREIDDIANLAFIGGKTNRSIKDKSPAEYLPPMLKENGEALFAAQSIPLEPALLDVSNYKAFLAERRLLISRALNDFIGQPTD